MRRFYGHFPFGWSRLLSYPSSSCSKGPAKLRRLQRTTCLRLAHTARCIFQTGSTGTSLRCRASTIRLLLLQGSFKRSCIQTSFTSTTQSQYPSAYYLAAAVIANVHQGHSRQEVQPPCLGVPRELADAQIFDSNAHSWCA